MVKASYNETLVCVQNFNVRKRKNVSQVVYTYGSSRKRPRNNLESWHDDTCIKRIRISGTRELKISKYTYMYLVLRVEKINIKELRSYDNIDETITTTQIKLSFKWE